MPTENLNVTFCDLVDENFQNIFKLLRSRALVKTALCDNLRINSNLLKSSPSKTFRMMAVNFPKMLKIKIFKIRNKIFQQTFSPMQTSQNFSIIWFMVYAGCSNFGHFQIFLSIYQSLGQPIIGCHNISLQTGQVPTFFS